MREKASFARVVSTQKINMFKRPNCLSFKTEKQIKRHEVMDILKKIGFERKKIQGITEMKGTKIDVTCSSRENVLELREKLAKREEFYNLYLYESDHVNVILGCVPIPFPDLLITEFLQHNYGSVDKIVQRTDRDGLKTGVRIAVMKKQDLMKYPKPSYISINNTEFYVTYNGQTVTCKYCKEPGHKQADCSKRLQDYPRLEHKTKQSDKDQLTGTTLDNILPRDVTSTPKEKVRGSLDRDSPSLEVMPAANQPREAVRAENTEASSKSGQVKSRPKRPLSSPEECNKAKMHSVSLSETKLPVSCLKCKNEGLSTENATSYHCWGCSQEFVVARTCCSNDLFLESMEVEDTSCPLCQRSLKKMACCNTFQSESRLDDGCYECVTCQRYSKLCKCSNFSCFGIRNTSKACKNIACQNKLINCECGERYIEELDDEPFV
ncbi:uncharacterized protein LOC144746232 [Ciona intestinalis]